MARRRPRLSRNTQCCFGCTPGVLWEQRSGVLAVRPAGRGDDAPCDAGPALRVRVVVRDGAGRVGTCCRPGLAVRHGHAEIWFPRPRMARGPGPSGRSPGSRWLAGPALACPAERHILGLAEDSSPLVGAARRGWLLATRGEADRGNVTHRTRDGVPVRRVRVAPFVSDLILAEPGAQHSMTLTARPPRAVSLYLSFMSAPVSRRVLIALSSDT
jgi:hypothetical protein